MAGGIRANQLFVSNTFSHYGGRCNLCRSVPLYLTTIQYSCGSCKVICIVVLWYCDIVVLWGDTLMYLEWQHRRKCRLIECNAKCRYLKKLTFKGTLRQVFYLSEAPSPPIGPHTPPPLQTLYVYTVYLFTRGREN